MLKHIFKITVIFFCVSIEAQIHNPVPDSLIGLSYDDLFIKMNSSKDSKLRLVYADTFLAKAKKEKDSSSIITGFEILAAISEPLESISSIDSIIKLTIAKPDEFNPANAYLQKGHKYYEVLDYKNSLDNYLNSYEESSKYFNQKLLVESRQGIALIKNRIGDYKSALEMHHKNLKNFKQDTLLFEKDDYLNTLFSLSVLSLRLSRIDSSSYYNHIGFQDSKEYNWEEKANHFRLAEGVVEYYKQRYSHSIDSLENSINILIEKNDRPNLIYAYFYLGQNHFKEGKNQLAINNLLKVDSLYKITGIIEPDTRVTYRQLHDFYESEGDSENQLFFLKKLISIDSTYYKNQKLIGSKITVEYDFPNLLSSKERLINTLKKGKKSLYYLLIFLVVLVGFVFIYYRRKQKIQLQKFEAIITGNNFSKELPKQKKKIDIPSDIINVVSQKLEKFEKNNDYIYSDITLVSLAKEINTNSNYLSKIINHTKGKNFASYLNELRINFAIKKLKNDKSFRKYTIHAIATDVGFKSAETFSKSFKSITQIYPSYFIKKLDEQ